VFAAACHWIPPLSSGLVSIVNGLHTLGMFGAGPIQMLAREMTAQLQALRAVALQETRARGTVITPSLDTKGVHCIMKQPRIETVLV
jgi:hypothetical protein